MPILIAFCMLTASHSCQAMRFGMDEPMVEDPVLSRRKSQTLSASSRSSVDSDSKTDLSILGIGGKVDQGMYCVLVQRWG